MIYYTSDTHFSHANILGFCRKQFKTIEEMNELIISNWNKTVMPDDVVYHLGDVHFGGQENYKRTIDRLIGYKVLIRGNHDKSRAKMLDFGFDEVYNHLVVTDGGKQIHLQHVPIGHDPYVGRTYPPELSTHPMPLYDYWLCGHVHEKWKKTDGGKIINVGVDQWNFTPITLSTAIIG